MIKTTELTGSEEKVSELGGQNVSVKNLSAGTLYASAFPNITAGADNVAEIPSGSGEVILDAHGTVYLLGSGKVQCTGTDHTTLNFKQPSSSSGTSSGGGGEEKGAYCGVTEFIGNMVGIKSTTIEYTNTTDFPSKLAEILAEETGWELQADGVTVLKDGEVGFKFTASHVYPVNNLGAPSDYNFQYINGGLYNGVTIDICASFGGTVAFGCRGINSDGTERELSLQFVLAPNVNGRNAVLAEYQQNLLYYLAKDQSTKITFNTQRLLSSNVKSTALTLLPDDAEGCLFKDLFYIQLCPSDPPGDSVFSIDGKRFRLLKSTGYSSNVPLLAFPI